MSASYIERDDWSAGAEPSTKQLEPSWEQVEDSLHSLDGGVHTLVKIALNDESYMVVAGGSDGKYIVFSTCDGRTFSNLTVPSSGDGQVVLDIGGQPGKYPLKHCVSFAVATEAAKVFFETGQLNPNAIWEISR